MRGDARFVFRRLEALTATPWFRRGAAAEQRLRALWCRLEAFEGAVEGCREGAWQLVAAHDPSPWFGEGTTLVFADRDRRDPSACEALVEALRAPGLHRRVDAWLEIDPRDDALLAALLADGWCIDSVISVGTVTEATRRARPLLGERAPAGTRFEPMGPGDVAGVVALQGRTFEAEPWWCWFGAYPAHLEGVRADLEAACRGQRSASRHWVLRGEGEVLGHLSLDVSDEAFWGRAAGVGIVLAPALRGRGYLKAAYALALEASRGLGARVWKGGTAQPAVLGLGGALGRQWHQIGLRRQGRFEPPHFLSHRP